MFNKKANQQKDRSKETEILSKSQLDQLKSAFSDISLSGKGLDQSQDFQLEKVEQTNRSYPIMKLYQRVKNTFYDLNSRSFEKYSLFATDLKIKKVIESRPELMKTNIALNSVEILVVIMCMVIPKKFVNKTLLSFAVLSFQMQLIQKFMLNFYIEQIALQNNRMDPVEQQARNLIEYKYRISKFDPTKSKQRDQEPYIRKLLEQVDQKNLQYMKFKKIELLI